LVEEAGTTGVGVNETLENDGYEEIQEYEVHEEEEAVVIENTLPNWWSTLEIL
jgi:hypothetical protein